MSQLTNESLLSNRSYCPAVFGHFCWPRTPANQSVNISCIVLNHLGVDSSS